MIRDNDAAVGMNRPPQDDMTTVLSVSCVTCLYQGCNNLTSRNPWQKYSHSNLYYLFID